MSIEAAQNFLKTAATDPALQARLGEMRAKQPDGGEDALGGVVSLARSHGHAFSVPDLESALRGSGIPPASGALSDAQLEAVAGGGVGLCGCQWPFKSSQLFITTT